MTEYHGWETSDGEHLTDIKCSEKTIVCKRKPVIGITIRTGGPFLFAGRKPRHLFGVRQPDNLLQRLIFIQIVNGGRAVSAQLVHQ